MPGPAQNLPVVAGPDRHLRGLHVEQMVIAPGAVRDAAVEAGFVEQLDAGDPIPVSARAGQLGQMAQHGDPGGAAADNADDHGSIPRSGYWTGCATRLYMAASPAVCGENRNRVERGRPGPVEPDRMPAQAARSLLRKFST